MLSKVTYSDYDDWKLASNDDYLNEDDLVEFSLSFAASNKTCDEIAQKIKELLQFYDVESLEID